MVPATNTSTSDSCAVPAGEVVRFLDRLRREEAVRHKSNLRRLSEIEQILQKAAGGNSEGGEPLPSGLKRFSPLKIVAEVVLAFGDQEFSLDDVCAVVAERYPHVAVTRDAISRRLFDLRTGSSPLIIAAEVEAKNAWRSRRYRLRSVKRQGPPLGAA